MHYLLSASKPLIIENIRQDALILPAEVISKELFMFITEA